MASPLKVPVIELEIDAPVVLASGPTIISFLVLTVVGSLRAFGRARDKLRLGKGADWRAEAADTYPNAIDLAFYTTPQTPKPISVLAYFVYPLFLTAGLAEAAWLWYDLAALKYQVSFRIAFVLTAVALWLLAAWQVGAIWVKRFARVPRLWRSSDT